MPPCTYSGIPPCQRVVFQRGLTRPALPMLPMRVFALPSQFHSARFSGIGLLALSMRWPQRLEAEPRHPGSCNVDRGVEILPGSQVGILNGQAALGQEVVAYPTTEAVNNWDRGIYMQTFRTLVMFVAVAIATVEGPILSGAQSASVNQPDSVSIHISLQKSSYVIGEKPIAVMAINNLSSKDIWFSTALNLSRIHVTSKDGEPPKTELHRHILGDFRPGDGPDLRSDSVGRDIAPGATDAQKYDLTYFYDLSHPGDYSVYLEIYDPAGPKDGSGHWLRTNTVNFKMVAPSQ